MKPEQRVHFQAVLESERDRIVALLDAAIAIPAAAAGGAPGEEPVAGINGAALVDDTALIARQSAALAEVDRALRLLREDPERYGVCTECGKPIASSRLELVPTARRCARHAGAAA